LTASFVILILAVTSLTYLYTFRETKSALKAVTQSELLALASVIASQLNGEPAEAMRNLKPGDEISPAFIQIRNRLLAMRKSHPDIRYVYTMRRSDNGVEFLVDPDYGNTEDPGAKIGETYTGSSMVSLMRGFEVASVDSKYNTDRWGTFLSGYAPFYDTQGTLVGIVGVDMIQDTVMQKQTFIGNTIYVVMGVGIFIAALFILLFSKTIIKDIHTLNNAANQISMGHMHVHIDVTRQDEIGELAESFGRMTTSLKIMMMTENN
jgi:adenylate cyclase